MYLLQEAIQYQRERERERERREKEYVKTWKDLSGNLVQSPHFKEDFYVQKGELTNSGVTASK